MSKRNGFADEVDIKKKLIVKPEYSKLLQLDQTIFIFKNVFKKVILPVA